eukprot:g15709.t2
MQHDEDDHAYLKNMKEQLTKFWAEQMQEMNVLEIGTEQDFKTHNDLPLARIKRIMKSDEDVRMISAEAPVLFAKACEMFILELTLRSWCYSEKNKRRTLQKEDIQAAIKKTEIFDFLVDVFNKQAFTVVSNMNMQSQLKKFWAEQMQEMDVLEIGTEQDFKNHNDLPLARIKRIMKCDEDVRMISAEAPVLFAKACEMFILELTLRSWCYSEKNKRRTLQKEDIQAAIENTDIFDFLVHVIE